MPAHVTKKPDQQSELQGLLPALLGRIVRAPVVSVDPHMDVRYCARMFEQFGLSVVPVIEDEKVIGIVSYNELVLRGL